MTRPILAWAALVHVTYDALTEPSPGPVVPGPGQPPGPEILGQPGAPAPTGPLINVPAPGPLGPLINVPAPGPLGPLINVPAPPGQGPLINVPAPQGPSILRDLPAGPPPVYKRTEPLPPAKQLVQGAQVFAGRRLPAKSAPNSVLVKVNPQTGQVTNYSVYDEDGNEIKRVDVTGAEHGGVPTPHVVDAKVNTNPQTGETFVGEERTARPARPEEIP